MNTMRDRAADLIDGQYHSYISPEIRDAFIEGFVKGSQDKAAEPLGPMEKMLFSVFLGNLKQWIKNEPARAAEEIDKAIVALSHAKTTKHERLST